MTSQSRVSKFPIFRMPVFVTLWVAMMAFKLPVVVLGLVVVPIMYRWRAVPFDDVPKIFTLWLNPEDWTGGPQGVVGESLPKWWIDRHDGASFGMWVHYHAIRNPANGIRNLEFLDLDIEQDKVRFWTPQYFRYYEPWHFANLAKLDPDNPDEHPKTGIYIAWQGWKAGIKIMHVWPEALERVIVTVFGFDVLVADAGRKYFVLKLGWRVEPRDAVEGLRPGSQRALGGAGFASKFLPYRDF